MMSLRKSRMSTIRPGVLLLSTRMWPPGVFFARLSHGSHVTAASTLWATNAAPASSCCI